MSEGQERGHLPGGMPPAEAVREALGRIGRSEDFSAAPKLLRFLDFVVGAKLDGREGEIKAYTIAVEALGRGAAFDPQMDPIVRVEATRLRRALSRYYAYAGVEETVEIEIPRGSYVPQIRWRDAGPPVPVASLPHEAADLDEAAEPQASSAAEAAGMRSLPVAAALVVLAVAAVIALAFVVGTADLASRLGLSSSVPEPPRTVRSGSDADLTPLVDVRPLEVVGAELSAAKVPRGLELKLRDGLARFDELRVTAGSEDGGARSNAEPADFMVSGWVAEGADRSTAVWLRLIDRPTGRIVWTREFTGPRAPLNPAAEDLIVRDMLGAIASSLPYMEQRLGELRPGDPYLACRAISDRYFRSYEASQLDAALGCTRDWARFDQRSVLARVRLSYLLADIYRYRRTDSAVKSPELQEARQRLEELVLQRPDNPRLLRALGFIAALQGDVGTARRSVERALALNPWDARVLTFAASVFAQIDDVNRAEDLLADYARRMPVGPPWYQFTAFLVALDRGDSAGLHAATASVTAEDYVQGLVMRTVTATFEGDAKTASEALDKLKAAMPLFAEDPRAAVTRLVAGARLRAKVLDALVRAGLKAS